MGMRHCLLWWHVSAIDALSQEQESPLPHRIRAHSRACD